MNIFITLGSKEGGKDEGSIKLMNKDFDML